MRILGIDPGKNGCGWAEFTNKTLTDCGYGYRAPGRVYDLVILERPNANDERAGRIDPQDLIDAGITGGRFAGSAMSPPCVFKQIFPVQWKGTVPKQIMLDRIMGVDCKDILSEKEKALITEYKIGKNLKHNIIDAVGIVLREIGRL